MRPFAVLCFLWSFTAAAALATPAEVGAELPAGVVRYAEINPAVPVFIPVHPRIATTVRFPRPIGEPMGTGFVEAEAFEKAAAEGKGVSPKSEYAITYLQGDAFFTVQPMHKSELLNLNVPYEGVTLVLYFHVVDHPLKAVASLVFAEPTDAAENGDFVHADARGRAEQPLRISRTETAPPSPFVPVSPARLEGFLRKLRLVHAAKRGPELRDVAAAFKVDVALSTAEEPSAPHLKHPVNDSGAYELILLRAVRDPALDAVGFVVLLRNKSDRELFFDVRTFSARCGAAFYTAQVVDAPARLGSGQIAAGYFVIVGAGDLRPAHLSAQNDWRLSVAVIESAAPETAASAPALAPRPAAGSVGTEETR